MAESVFDRLHGRLQQQGVHFTVLRHEPVFTSEQAAAVRGTSLSSGAKAIVVKAGERFVLLVLPADLKLDSRKALARKPLSVARVGPPHRCVFGRPAQLGPVANSDDRRLSVAWR